MGSLGFRPPQFSEELPWLPACLQRITDTSAQARSPSHQQFKVLHFRLNLSLDDDSQYYQSQLFGTSCAQHGSKNALQLPQMDISAGEKIDLEQKEDSTRGVNALPMISISRNVGNVGEKTDLIQIKDSAYGVNALQMISISRDVEDVGGQPSNHTNGCSERSVEKVTGRNHKSTDIKDAVELSIAASEALVIHELVRSESASEAFPTAAVLEAALQVKQARLESSEGSFDCPTETSDQMDFLSDLDDLTMADAFEDVGLSFSCFSNQHACGSEVSLVKDTPVSEDSFGSGNRTENAEHFSPQNKPSDDPTSRLKNSDPILHEIVQEISHVSETAERVGFSMVDASLPSQADLHCLDLYNLKNVGESNASPFVTDGFRSRWVGGWTAKEVDTEQPKPKTKYFTKCFAAETSFFSESADVAPDENSLVRKCVNKRSNIASDQSVHFEGLPDQVDEDIMISQDLRCSYPSLVDPLCSIVPCSISSENVGTALGQNGNSGEGFAGNCPGTGELWNENIHVESIFETKQALSKLDGEYSAAKIQRQVTSLKTYSKVSHENDSVLGSPRLCVNQLTTLHSRDKNSGIRFCDKRNTEMSLALCSIPECASGQDAEENIPVNNPDGKEMNNQNYEYAKDNAELQNQPSIEKSPLILPQRMSQRLQAAKLLDCGSKANAEQAIAEDVSVFRNSDSNRQGMQAECNNASASRPSKRFKSDAQIQDGQRSSTIHLRNQKSLLFQDIKFLLTGFSRGKEKEIEGLVWKYGGTVLVDIPFPSNRGKRCSRQKFQQLPIILCPKKLQTTKFLYACAVKSLILKDKWLTDSVAAGSALSPAKYMVLPNQPETMLTKIGKPVRHDNSAYIFNGIGVMLHGKPHFCTKFAKVIQHGGGCVFRTLLWLIQNLDSEKISLAVIVSEGENRASRHLRECASERKIPMMPSSWIVRSLYSGKLLPFTEKKQTTLQGVIAPDFQISENWSQEI
ncbi:hypothetical protein V6N13_091631 [Hibiscus sabdariffa]